MFKWRFHEDKHGKVVPCIIFGGKSTFIYFFYFKTRRSLILSNIQVTVFYGTTQEVHFCCALRMWHTITRISCITGGDTTVIDLFVLFTNCLLTEDAYI
jgi:hypothetical protein